MSAIITKYYSKLNELESLKAEIENLKSSEELKQELKFKAAIEKLMDEHAISAKDFVRVLEGMDPNLHTKTKSPRKARPVMQYTNPEGETLRTKGGNNKTLKEWKEKWGEDVIEKTKKKVS